MENIQMELDLWCEYYASDNPWCWEPCFGSRWLQNELYIYGASIDFLLYIITCTRNCALRGQIQGLLGSRQP